MQARELIEESVVEAREIIENARKEYESLCTQEQIPPIGLEAQAIEGGEIIERFNLLLEWDDIRIELISRNQSLNNLPKRYVSGRSRAK